MAETYDRDRVHAVIKGSAPWYRSPSVLHLYILVLSPLVTSSSWGFDLSMTNGLQSVSQFMDNFGNPQGSNLGFYGAASSVGGVVATIIGGPMVDRFGRRALCFVGSAIVIGMSIMETFASSFAMFTAGKLLLGLGANLMQIGGPMLVAELAHPASRVAITSFYNTNIYIGLVIGAWVTYGTFPILSAWSWKIPCLLQIVLPTYQLLTIWLCPESPRWLVSKGRVDEARRILVRYHGGGVETELVRHEMQEILANVESDRTQLRFNREGIATVLGSRGNLHRLWISFATAVGSQCLGSTLVSAYLPDVLDQVGFSSSKDKTLINGLVQICSWLASIVGALIIPHVRRRRMFLGITGLMLLMFVVWTALAAEYVETRHTSYGLGVVVMIFLFNMTYCVCWVPLVVAYPLETVTNKQRGMFYSWMMFCINSSAFVIQYVNPIGIQNISWKYYLIQTIFIAVFIVAMYFTFVETHGYTLEEISVLFDGEEGFNSIATVHAAEMEKASGQEIEDARGDGIRGVVG